MKAWKESERDDQTTHVVATSCFPELFLPVFLHRTIWTPTSTTIMASGPAPGMVLQPRVDMMIVSVARHKNSIEDNVSICQLPLVSINYQPNPSISLYAWLKSEALQTLRTMIEARLRISLAHMSIVWYMIESGQLATVIDRESLCAAIMDHINFRRYTIQLYVVDNFGEIAGKLEKRSSDR